MGPRRALLSAALTAPLLLAARTTPQPVSDIHYRVTVDRETAAARTIPVEMSFRVTGPEPIVLSLPAWTPGSYEIDDFARYVSGFSATRGDAPIRWDKTDPDSWRVYPGGAGTVTVRFEYAADTLDVGMAYASEDFAFFNGTNLFPYPEGQPLEFPARVSILAEPGWRIATGMQAGGGRGEYSAQSYHELVDMPFFVGAFDLDSVRVEGLWYRLGTYPEGALAGRERSSLWQDIGAMLPPMAAVFGETPWEDYTILAAFDAGYGGGAALEHANSHLGIYSPAFIGSPLLASIIAHEIFHAWNVKRLRPQELWPYEYDRPQPTTLLWVSEGITDYYADLALVRGGIVRPEFLYLMTAAKIDGTGSVVPVALEDASLSTWIEPTDGSALIYYDKGSLAGLQLDILIRDATDNRASLDEVMRDLYRSEYLTGSGFTDEEWWSAVSRAAGGRSFEEFRLRYVDGREPYPWDETLPRAGLLLVQRTERQPFVDAAVVPDGETMRITEVVPGSAAEASGIRPGDILLRIGDMAVEDGGFARAFLRRYGDAPDGTTVEIELLRDGTTRTVRTELQFEENTTHAVQEDPDASPRARRIRDGILTGRVDGAVG